jgi:phospholipase/carboxylesterase
MTSHVPFHSRFEPATRPGLSPLLLLHGTGGDETDLLPLGRSLSPGAALLSPRGQVLEGGMPRFFRRLAEGVFDEEDVRRRAADLADFVTEARTTYGIAAPIAVGFSNGANVAAAMLMLHPETLSGAVLLRAMPPLANPPSTPIDSTPVLLLSGRLDPIVSEEGAARLASDLKRGGARVRHEVLNTGHGLGRDDVDRASVWIEQFELGTL